MKQLLNTSDQSLAENARLALDAERIETLIKSDTSATAHGSIVLSIVDDDTFDRAQAVLRDISVTPPPFPHSYLAPLAHSSCSSSNPPQLLNLDDQ